MASRVQWPAFGLSFSHVHMNNLKSNFFHSRVEGEKWGGGLTRSLANEKDGLCLLIECIVLVLGEPKKGFIWYFQLYQDCLG